MTATRRYADSLSESERDAVWQCNDPLWPALYCWHDGQWWYATKNAPWWRKTLVGAGECTSDGGFTALTPMTDAIFGFGTLYPQENTP